MKAYTIICHKGKKTKLKLLDIIAFNKKSDAKQYLKRLPKDLEKEGKFTYYEDGDDYTAIDNKTKDEYTLFIQHLELR